MSLTERLDRKCGLNEVENRIREIKHHVYQAEMANGGVVLTTKFFVGVDCMAVGFFLLNFLFSILLQRQGMLCSVSKRNNKRILCQTFRKISKYTVQYCDLLAY